MDDAFSCSQDGSVPTVTAMDTPYGDGAGAGRHAFDVGPTGMAEGGTVTLTSNGGEWTDRVLPLGSDGSVTFDLPEGLKPGSHGFAVAYSGTSTVLGSQVSASVQITRLESMTTVESPSSEIEYLADGEILVRVTGSDGVTPVGDGHVSVVGDGVWLGWVPVVDGIAQLPTAWLPVGVHQLVANYEPYWSSDVYAASTSEPFTVTIKQAQVDLQIVLTADKFGFGDPIAGYVRATDKNSARQVGGQVELMLDGETTMPMLGGTGTWYFSLPQPPVGEHALSAVFNLSDRILGCRSRTLVRGDGPHDVHGCFGQPDEDRCRERYPPSDRGERARSSGFGDHGRSRRRLDDRRHRTDA